MTVSLLNAVHVVETHAGNARGTEDEQCHLADVEENPVITSAEYAYQKTKLVRVSDDGVSSAARYIHHHLTVESYTPRTWRTHPLHICPPEPYNPDASLNKVVLDWIFLISCLNFSFWSEKEGSEERYGVEWQEGWEGSAAETRTVHKGYWSLVAALNRAISDDGIPITDPAFYSSETRCPDSLIEHVFRPADESAESIPLLKERIAIMREVGHILCERFDGSFKGFAEAFQREHNGEGTALELVKMVAETFPSYRDETWLDGQEVYLWKRAQILVAETWAAFYPPSVNHPHPLFPGSRGASIHQLTMFADYRVPQILHHLRIITYPPSLLQLLKNQTSLDYGSPEELSLRSASIVAVERVRKEICVLLKQRGEREDRVSSVLIDFYLWDLAKKIEVGEDKIEGIDTAPLAPIHRTRSIWY